jgi:flagellar biosynthesis/type III secretory pathway chaperone
MTLLEALQQHQLICDELYELSQEENRFLQQHQRPAAPGLVEKKRSLLARLDTALATLRNVPPGDTSASQARGALDRARSRILQILQLDRENEQLLTRFSLGAGAVRPATAAHPGLLQIYSKL